MGRHMGRTAPGHNGPMDPQTVEQLASPEGRELLASLPDYDEGAVLGLTSTLRAQGVSPELTAALLTQSRLRHRARGKLGALAGRLLLTADGLEQATRPQVAALHAARLAHSGVDRVLDLGCGIGSDALAFADAGLAVEAVDGDPVTAAVAAANLSGVPRAHVSVGLAETALDGRPADEIARTAAWFDPARRTPGIADIRGRTKRVFRLQDMSPTWEVVQQVAAAVPAAGAKLSPSFPHQAVPPGAEAQWVSVDGEVVECVVWWGAAVRRPGRCATVLRGDQAWTVAEEDAAVGAAAPPTEVSDGVYLREGVYLHEADKAVVRAGLVAALERAVDGTEVEPGVGYVLTAGEGAVPWARRYRVLEVLDADPKALRRWARRRDVGALTIKKRGVPGDSEALRRKLIGKTGVERILVLTRHHGRQIALEVEACASD